MIKKIFAVLLVLAMTAVLFTACGGDSDSNAASSNSNKTESTPSSSGSTVNKYKPEPDVNAEEISVYTENFKLSNAAMSYIVNSSYANFVSTVEYYGQYYGVTLESLGLDISKSIKDQKCGFDEFDGTWFDYFYKDAKATVDEMLAICEAAKAAGHTLTDEEQKSIDDSITSIVNDAATAKLTVDEYLEQNFGTGITIEVVNSILEYSGYANSYLTKIQNDVDVSDSALEAKYNANPNAIDTVDFILCSFDFNDLVPEGADDAAIETAKNTCRTHASEIAKAASAEEFLSKLKTVLVDEFALTEAEAEKTVNAITYKGQRYSDDVVFNWAFGDVNPGDTKVFEDEESGMIAAAFFLGRTSKSESSVKRDVYHILFANKVYDDDTVVNQVYSDWVEGGASLDAFKTLVGKYSGDEGSISSQGLYEDVPPGKMVDEFNDWLFDPARQEGDHGIVETEFGWHIMYAGAGEGVQWKSDVTDLIKSEAVENAKTAAKETYKVTYVDEFIATLPL